MNDAKNLVPEFFEKTAHNYDDVVSWTTFGKDNKWKKSMIEKIQNPSSILDLACGTGILTKSLAMKFPNCDIVGLDITKSYLDLARTNLKEFENISLFLDDAETFCLDKKFDYIISSYIPKYCSSDLLVKSCIAHLKSSGTIIFHDFSYPDNYVIQKLWNFYFKLLQVSGIFLPEWRNVFSQLPELIKSSTWIEQYRTELRKNNFDVFTDYQTMNTSCIISGRYNS